MSLLQSEEDGSIQTGLGRAAEAQNIQQLTHKGIEVADKRLKSDTAGKNIQQFVGWNNLKSTVAGSGF